MILYEVAVVAPLRQTLTYEHPVGLERELRAGMRVQVPLGGRFVTGYILGRDEAGQKNGCNFKIKSIVDPLDPEPVFPAELISLYRWLADYYHYPIGEVIRTALPADMSAAGGRRVRLTETGRAGIAAELVDGGKPLDDWIETLLGKGELTPAKVAALWRNPSRQRLLKKWQDRQWVEVEQQLVGKRIKDKTEIFVQLAGDSQELLTRAGDLETEGSSRFLSEKYPDLKKSELKTLTLFCDLCREYECAGLARPQLTRQYSGAGKALKGLSERGITRLETREVYRDPFGEDPPYYPRPEKLTPEQEQALARLEPAIKKQGFQPFLLRGVTGCGKTELYMRAAETALAQGRTVLVMVPEIALSTQLEAHFFSRFGDRLAILHSGLTPGQRHDQWSRILAGKARVVIGARSAVFAPLAAPGLIIVDEEHEPAYKQDDSLRYNGRDLAVLRAKFADCPVLLGSATPSVTSYHHTVTGKYQLLTMAKRVLDRPMPEVRVVDLGKKKKYGVERFFSDELLTALQDNLDEGRQSLLFVNRRGFASFVLCNDCGYIVECSHCRVSLTMHKGRGQLVCHYCGYTIKSNIVCPACSSGEVIGLGLGSERLEEEVRNLFPEARVGRLDSDTASKRKHYIALLKAVRQGEIDILIGTQMIAKGLDFPNVTLVGVIWADSGLGIPDFRASERTFQLLAQVTGRAGRGEHPGRVIIQTHQPQHYAISCARAHDYQTMFERELELRSQLGYPPFSRLINIRLRGKKEQQVMQAARAATDFLRTRAGNASDIQILGPAPAPLVKIKDHFRWQILLKSGRPSALHQLCDQLLAKQAELCPSGVVLLVDVDPENMM